ncbi:MAG: porin, partial [Candidatus Omnitrophota bacterium]|nr:porin [Candidatus Omnitrophota bacterium]
VSKEETGGSAFTTSIMDFAKKTEIHGFVDTSYIFNTNTPKSPNPHTNRLRVFDVDSNSFMLNLAEINLEKPVSQESPVGFRVDLDAGQDAEVFGATGLGTRDDEFDLQQAYVQLQLPFSLPYLYSLNAKIGKFVTLHGAEVIESVDNWNFSLSFLFGYAIPFNHTGVRLYYKPVESWPIEGYFGLVNGWDNVTDNNNGKTIESMIAVTPFENFSVSVAGLFGPERADSNDYRDLLDVVATYKLTDKFTVKANYDYGWERNGAGVGKNASWDGIAGYAKYDIFNWWSIAGRGEYFHDRDGVRTGLGVSDLKLWELTATSEFKIYKDIIARLEYRHDHADHEVFYHDNNGLTDYQNTLSAEMIYKF